VFAIIREILKSVITVAFILITLHIPRIFAPFSIAHRRFFSCAIFAKNRFKIVFIVFLFLAEHAYILANI
jgi:hypothetical protein